MPVRIRLARMGAKKRPFYRVVVANSEAPRDGRFIEILGTYDPKLETAKLRIRAERLKYWLDQGAIPSETVAALCRADGLTPRKLAESFLGGGTPAAGE